MNNVVVGTVAVRLMEEDRYWKAVHLEVREIAEVVTKVMDHLEERELVHLVYNWAEVDPDYKEVD